MGKESINIFPDSTEELAALLDYNKQKLKFLLFGLPEDRQYREFEIPKRNGKTRSISAPVSAIKTIQRRLADYLNDHYEVKSCAYGFVKKKDAVLNAKVHHRRRWVVNLDIEDFFPSINFGRVRGAFLGRPFNCSEEVATLLAQICCFKGILPQGAPTSPIISNIICRQLDNKLLDFARAHKLTYSRYADDISFSTNLKYVPNDLGRFGEGGIFELNPEFEGIIGDCGFKLNQEKTRCCSHYHRQEVTGIITNEKVNVRRQYVKQIRCMLNAYEKYGLTAAAKEHFSKFSNKKSLYPEHTFRRMLVGKIGYLGHVKGKDDKVYKALARRLKALDPSVPLTIPYYDGEEDIILYGEGKTDTMHLEAAFRHFELEGKYSDLRIKFYKYRRDDQVNNDALYDLCRTRSLQKHDSKIEIYIFDRDVPSFTKKVTTEDEKPRGWGSNVFSMVLPKVAHRDFDELCIEHFYKYEDLLKPDSAGRRIYLSDEFDKETAHHKTEELRYRSKNKLKANYPKILDQDVFDDSGKNVALSKMAFANNILQKKPPFDSVDFSAFAVVFDIIHDIAFSAMKK